MWEQAKALQEGAEIVVCTPVREKINSVNLWPAFKKENILLQQMQDLLFMCAQGRLIDHVKKKATSLQRVTYLVFDEADRMFDMGFGWLALSILKDSVNLSVRCC